MQVLPDAIINHCSDFTAASAQCKYCALLLVFHQHQDRGWPAWRGEGENSSSSGRTLGKYL